jgi:hypothetical protein
MLLMACKQQLRLMLSFVLDLIDLRYIVEKRPLKNELDWFNPAQLFQEMFEIFNV